MFCSYVRVLLLLWKISRIFFVYGLREPLGFHWFKKVLLYYFSFHLYLLFFQKMIKVTFCAWISSTSFCQTFFSHKNRIGIYLIHWNLLAGIFSGCLVFERNHTDFIPLFLKKYISFIKIATNFLCCFLEEFHLVLLLATIWRSSLTFYNLKFRNHFFLIINQKVGYHTYIRNIYFPKILLS